MEWLTCHSPLRETPVGAPEHHSHQQQAISFFYTHSHSPYSQLLLPACLLCLLLFVLVVFVVVWLSVVIGVWSRSLLLP